MNKTFSTLNHPFEKDQKNEHFNFRKEKLKPKLLAILQITTSTVNEKIFIFTIIKLNA